MTQKQLRQIDLDDISWCGYCQESTLERLTEVKDNSVCPPCLDLFKTCRNCGEMVEPDQPLFPNVRYYGFNNDGIFYLGKHEVKVCMQCIQDHLTEMEEITYCNLSDKKGRA